MTLTELMRAQRLGQMLQGLFEVPDQPEPLPGVGIGFGGSDEPPKGPPWRNRPPQGRSANDFWGPSMPTKGIDESQRTRLQEALFTRARRTGGDSQNVQFNRLIQGARRGELSFGDATGMIMDPATYQWGEGPVTQVTRGADTWQLDPGNQLAAWALGRLQAINLKAPRAKKRKAR